MTRNSAEILAKWIGEAKRIVFFGGAGTSTESGIPDFRSAGGLYESGQNEFPFSPEEMLSSDFFYRHTETFYRFYRRKMIYSDAQPNPMHLLLADLEHEGRLSTVITQNIDGLHQKAGSRRVLEVHGSVLRNTCLSCGEEYGLDAVMGSEDIPLCSRCGGMLKPNVVLYGEMLDSNVLEASVRAIEEADLMLVGGTSLTVQPAASLVGMFTGGRLALLNRTPTPYDSHADLLVTEPMGEVAQQVRHLLGYK
ncbi:NAD-dependent protein deacylase [Saccharibacillus kuerlensis]|uniref:NAD-dependent protein deacetylase n=1 Tax=Saccharibacillus kuerlensis TaxID=459527 RepID=A0ABQ2KYQ4_9BACL|nr:NAD-dependent protein deacylase [Saccharibacillus kuerlensis]GGN97281.1 NAD-dependent protein deacetylase [Saccharibacillus kuerlensis]